jgi:hypothetical protein
MEARAWWTRHLADGSDFDNNCTLGNTMAETMVKADSDD